MAISCRFLSIVAGTVVSLSGSSYVAAVGSESASPEVAGRSVVAQQQRVGAQGGAVLPQHALLSRYCFTCHNQRTKAGGLVLEGLDLARVGEDAPVWEKVVRKVRAGMMPPVGQPRPNRAAADGVASWLETELDRAAAAKPNPGRTEAMHRLNRAEYRNATRDLLDIDIDVSSLLPADDASYGFDNIAGILRLSPTLMEKYLAAAGKVSRAAVGIPPEVPNFEIFRVPDELLQDDRLDDLPFGTRGGTLIRYNFPADGEYVVRVRLARQTSGQDFDVPRYDRPQQLEVSLDGDRLQVFTLAPSKPLPLRTRTNYGGSTQQPQARIPVQREPPQQSGAQQQNAQPRQGAQQQSGQPPLQYADDDDCSNCGHRNDLDANWQVRFLAKAGPREIAVTWLNRTPSLLETRVQPYLNPFPTGSNTWTPRKGAYVSRVEISGPFNPQQASEDIPSRRRIFTCRPASPSDEAKCSKTILSTLARRAFRRPVTDADLASLLTSYNEGRADGGFDAGIALAVQHLLVSPEFLFRVQVEPASIRPGTAYRISDLELAARLSFFFWSSIPDDELLDLAARGKLRNPAVLDRQIRRMLADPRSRALVDNFVGQWLLLRNVPALRPDPYNDPDFDESLRLALRRETELFFESIMREDRSVLELLTANYTFVNERLAKHYGIPNVQGTHFRRVMVPDSNPRAGLGLLGHGSILVRRAKPARCSE